MSEYNTGDVVVLKSGSMPMVVESVEGGVVRCVWANQGVIGRESFPAAIMKKFEPSERRFEGGDRGGDRGGPRPFGGKPGGGKPFGRKRFDEDRPRPAYKPRRDDDERGGDRGDRPERGGDRDDRGPRGGGDDRPRRPFGGGGDRSGGGRMYSGNKRF